MSETLTLTWVPSLRMRKMTVPPLSIGAYGIADEVPQNEIDFPGQGPHGQVVFYLRGHGGIPFPLLSLVPVQDRAGRCGQIHHGNGPGRGWRLDLRPIGRIGDELPHLIQARQGPFDDVKVRVYAFSEHLVADDLEVLFDGIEREFQIMPENRE